MITNADDVFAEYASRRDHVYALAHRKMKKYEQLYEGVVNCYQPDGEPGYIPPEGYNQVEKAAGQIASGYPVFDVYPNETKDEKAVASKLIKACELTRKYSSKTFGDYDREKANFLALYGAAFVQGPFYDPNRRFPIWVKPILPYYVYPSPSGRDVIIAYERKAVEVKDDIDRWNSKTKKRPFYDKWFSKIGDNENVTWVEYWSPDKRCFTVDWGGKNSPVSDMQTNQYGYIPISGQYSGKGFGASAPPEKRCIGVLEAMASDIEMEAMSKTAMLYHLRKAAYGKLVADEEFESYFRKTVGAGEILLAPKEAMPSMGGVENLPFEEINPQIYNILMTNKESLQETGGPGAVVGLGSSEESGVKQMARIRQEQTRYRPMREASERIESDVFTKMAQLIANENVVTEPLPLNKRESIKGSEIDPYTLIEVTMESVDPAYDQLMVELGSRLAERNFITVEDLHRDYLKNPKADEVLAKIFAEKLIMGSPEILQAHATQYLKEQGYDEEAAKLEEMMRQSISQGGEKKQTIDSREYQRLQGAAGEEPTQTPQIQGVPGG